MPRRVLPVPLVLGYRRGGEPEESDSSESSGIVEPVVTLDWERVKSSRLPEEFCKFLCNVRGKLLLLIIER